MKVISFSHVDQHAKLLQMVDAARPRLLQRIKDREDKIEKIRLEIVAFKALPWYKRWFQLTEPSYDMECDFLYFDRHNMKTLAQIWTRAQYDVTIELSENETNLLFLDAPQKV